MRKINDRDNVTATRISKKKTIGLMSKPTTFHVEHSFLHDYGEKLPNFMFYGEREQAMTTFFFLELGYCPLFNFWRVHLHFTK